MSTDREHVKKKNNIIDHKLNYCNNKLYCSDKKLYDHFNRAATVILLMW